MDRLLLSLECHSLLLEALPERDLTHMMPLMTLCRVTPKQVLMQRGERIDYVYFPYDAVLAAVVECTDGHAPEAGAIGREGFAPADALLGAGHAADTMVCVVEGICGRMRLADFQHETAGNPRLRIWLEQYCRFFQAQLYQRVACNRLHVLGQRYARTLLSLLDRSGGSEVSITHEHLAALLAANRPSLTAVAHAIQQEGVVDHIRGQVRVLDRHRLEHHACECYGKTRASCERLLGMRIG